MVEAPRRIPVVFYRTPAGVEVVLEWLRELDDEDRRVTGRDLMRVQFRWPVGMPLCRPLGDGLWELRCRLSGNRIARLFFSFAESRLIALHRFVKKSQKTPPAELAIARKRKNEFE
jgi:phage-related protein